MGTGLDGRTVTVTPGDIVLFRYSPDADWKIGRVLRLLPARHGNPQAEVKQLGRGHLSQVVFVQPSTIEDL